MLRGPCNNITMIKFIKELIKKWSRIEEQDPHLVLYEKPNHCDEHSKYKHRCPDCQEAVK